MELGRVYEEARNNKSKMKEHFHGGTIALNPDNVIVIKIPDAQVLRILSRSLFLAIVLASLPFLGIIFRGFPSNSSSFASPESGAASGYVHVELLNSVMRDLAYEGLYRSGDKALIVSSFDGFDGIVSFNSNEVDVVMDSDLGVKSLFPDESYDFVFISSSEDADFVDRILKVDGIVALPLGTKPSNAAFREQSNYRVVYLRRYGSIIVALRKTGLADKSADSSQKRKIFQLATEAKAMALKGLEDVLLEPPREAIAKSEYMRNFKYLPDLLGDSLEGFSRRLFIGVGLPEENKSVVQWFKQNYPKKNAKFEIHGISAPHTDVSAWLSKHVKEEEYVVMKAEAEVVEEMIKNRTVCLVDEIFLECKNEWWQKGKKRKKSGRAYWECLALYGRLRDEGVAVHQWWG